MRWPILLVLAAVGCSAFYPDPSRTDKSPRDWKVPVGEPEYMVSPPIDYDAIETYAGRMARQGWEFVEARPAGVEIPAKHIVVLRRQRYGNPIVDEPETRTYR